MVLLCNEENTKQLWQDLHGLDELYDLKNDPGELTNLYKDPQHREVRARLQQRLEKRMKVIRDPILRKSQ
jgi:arylsulfatase A-like enzyme